MNLVFAYHTGDCELALESAQAITAMGLNMRHKAYLCCTNNTPYIDEITLELKKTFTEVGRIPTQEGFDGWPLGPNIMFSDASSFMYNNNTGQDIPDAFLFWEPDCVPMKKGWLDDLETEYLSKPAIIGHVFAGGTASNGKNIYNMIVGSAIYPANFLDFCSTARSLYSNNLVYRDQGIPPEPWDVRCRWNFLAIGRDTPLMRTYRKSNNYRFDDGDLVFGATDEEAHAIQEVTCPSRTVSPQAVVVHGCKDGSLHRLAISGFKVETKKQPPKKKRTPKKKKTERPKPSPV